MLTSLIRKALLVLATHMSVKWFNDTTITAAADVLAVGLLELWSQIDRNAIKAKTKEKTETEIISRNAFDATKTSLIIMAFVPLMIGCTSYSHERFSDTGQPIEKTTLRAPWLTKQAITGLKSRVTDQRGKDVKYTRSIGADISNETDSQGIDALGNLLEKVAKGAAAGAGKAIIP